MAEYKGTVKLIAGITQTNGDFALVNAPDVQVDNTDKRLNTKLSEIDSAVNLKAPIASPTFTGTPKSVTPASNSDGKMIATKEYVDNHIDVVDAFQYKGTITAYSQLPSDAKKGWTYKVATAFTNGGVNYEAGDMFIRNTDTAGTDISSWDVVQKNLDGAVIGPASATNNRIALFDGTTGKLIKQSSYTAGAAAAKGVDTSISSGSTSANLPTTAAVASYVDSSVSSKTEIDDTAGDGVTDKVWSADKSTDELALKANKANPVFSGKVTVNNGGIVAHGRNLIASGMNSHIFGLKNVENPEIPDWEPDTQYYAGDVVKVNNYMRLSTNSSQFVYMRAILKCKADHTSASSIGAYPSRTEFLENWTSIDEDRTSSKVEWSETNEMRQYVEIVGGGYGENPITRVNIRTLDWNGNEMLRGNLYVGCNVDSTGGYKVARMVDLPDVTGKADKVNNATSGNFAELDANGNLVDSGHKHSDYLTSYNPILDTITINIPENNDPVNKPFATTVTGTMYDYGHCYVSKYWMSNPEVFSTDLHVYYSSDTLYIKCSRKPNTPASTVTLVFCKQTDATADIYLNTGYQAFNKIDEKAPIANPEFTGDVIVEGSVYSEGHKLISSNNIASISTVQSIIDGYSG